MAAGTGEAVVAGEQGIEKQVATEIDLLRRESVPRLGEGGLQAADAGVIQRVVAIVQSMEFADIAVCQLETGRAIVA